MTPSKNHVTIVPVKAHGNSVDVNINWQFEVLFKEDSNQRFSCFIPAFDIYYHAKTSDDANKKALAMTQILFDHLVVHAGKNSLKQLALHLHKLGFRSKSDQMVMKQLVNNHAINAKFNAETEIYPEFSSFERVQKEANMNIAVPA